MFLDRSNSQDSQSKSQRTRKCQSKPSEKQGSRTQKINNMPLKRKKTQTAITRTAETHALGRIDFAFSLETHASAQSILRYLIGVEPRLL